MTRPSGQVKTRLKIQERKQFSLSSDGIPMFIMRISATNQHMSATRHLSNLGWWSCRLIFFVCQRDDGRVLIYSVSSTAIIFAPVGGDGTCGAFSQVQNHKLCHPKLTPCLFPLPRLFEIMCCFALLNIRKIMFLTQHATQLLIQARIETVPCCHTADRAPVAASSSLQVQFTYADLQSTSWLCFLQ